MLGLMELSMDFSEPGGVTIWMRFPGSENRRRLCRLSDAELDRAFGKGEARHSGKNHVFEKETGNE